MRFAISIILVFLISSARAEQYNISHFDKPEELSESFIYSIVQDHNAYLWLGTSDGLFRYDGSSFKYFSRSDSLAENFITSAISYNKSVWLGHQNGELTCIEDNVFEIFRLPIQGMSSVSKFRINSLGELWFATYSNGLFRVLPDKKIQHFAFIQENISVHDFLMLADNKILIGSDDGLRLCEINEEGSIDILNRIIEIPESKVVSILQLASSKYIIATQGQGVYSLEIAKNYNVKTILSQKALKDNLVTSLLLDNKQNLWLTTFGGGLLKLTDINNSSGLFEQKWFSNTTKSYIRCQFLDRDENIWLGNYGAGLSKLSSNPFSIKVFPEVQSKGGVIAMSIDNNCKWLATKENLFCIDTSNNISQEYDLSSSILSSEIVALLNTDGSDLWIGTNGEGLFQLDKSQGEISKIIVSDGILENTITNLKSTSEYLWIGTKKGLVRYTFQSKEIKWYNIQQGGLPHNVVNHIYIDGDNSVWLTTQSNTLIHIVEDKIYHIDIPSQNSVFTLNAVTKDKEGYIWIASNGNGVYKVSNDSVLNLTESEGLFSNYCYSLVADSRGFIWITHRGGITRIHSRTLATRSIQKYAGLTIDDEFSQNASIIDNDNNLWLATERGILNFNPNLEPSLLLPPVLNITSLRLDDEEKDLSEKLKFPYGRYKISIDFIGISLREPENVKYQFRLIGFDSEWSEITSLSSASFSSVGPGQYTFEVIASSSDGVISKSPLQIDFIVKKPLWNLGWFYLVVFILLFTLGFGYIKRREHNLVQTNLILENKVNKRTQEILRQKDEIERQGDIIKRKNLDITDSIKYARNIQKAIFPPEDILKEALQEYFLINRPKDIVSGDFCWYTKHNGSYVIAVTDCTGHGVPGSIMSMLGITLFNEVVNNLGVINSAQILELMREKVISALNQHKKENPSYDGMNVGLCVINSDNNFIQYSGAFHNLVHIHKGEINLIKAERTPIGYTPLDMPAFIAHDVKFAKGDMFYMYSDGYQDQFGGENDRKFTNRRLMDILKSIQANSMQEQKFELENILSNWMDKEEQTDDIILLGFRV